MSNKEKFEGLKKEIIYDNERKYGKEIRKKYGNDCVESSNKKFKNLTKDEYNYFIQLENDINMKLAEAFKTEDPSSYLAQEVAHMHKKWLCFTWSKYTKEAHAALAQMYIDDERFAAYYDKNHPGLAKFLRDSILIYTDINN